MSEPRFTPLLPPGDAALEAENYLRELDLAGRRPAGRPLVLANMVSSADGNATFRGRSGALSDAGDRALFHALRGASDAVLSGTGTIGAERYGPAKNGPVVTIARSGKLPTDIPLFREPAGRVIAFCGEPPDLTGVRAQVSVEPVTALSAILATLHTRYGIGVLLCEGGPSLLGALLRENLVDQLFLTLAPRVAGGAAGPSVTAGDPAPELIPLTLAAVLEREGTLYLRYARPEDPGCASPASAAPSSS